MLSDRLQAIFANVLELDPSLTTDELPERDYLGWDSISHMALVVAIEDEFGVEFSPEQVIEMDSFSWALKALHDLHAGQ